MPGLEQPIEGQIAEQLADLLRSSLAECDYSFNDILMAVKTHPRAGVAVELFSLFSASRAGVYSHPNEDVNAFLHRPLTDSVRQIAAESIISRLAGFSVNEFVHEPNGGRWELTGLPALDPGQITFEATPDNKAISHIEFDNQEIPLGKAIHIVSGRHLAFGNPYGCSAALRIMGLTEAWKLSMNMWAVAAQRHSTPTTHWQVEDDAKVNLLDANGNPMKDSDGNLIMISAVTQVKEVVEEMQSTSNFVVTSDKVDSKTINSGVGFAGFFGSFCDYLDKSVLIGLLVPETLLGTGQGGLGNGGLSKSHIESLIRSIDATNQQVHEQLLKKVAGRLIAWNFGESMLTEEGPGAFEIGPDDEDLRLDLLNILVGVLGSPSVGLHTQAVVDKAYDLLGVPRQEGIAPSLIGNQAPSF